MSLLFLLVGTLIANGGDLAPFADIQTYEPWIFFVTVNQAGDHAPIESIHLPLGNNTNPRLTQL